MKEVTYTVRVEFGDCDPAGIVWFPNFFRWIDAASRHFFIECGVPPWRETEKTLGVIGTPLVDTHARFVKTASYGDTRVICVYVPNGSEVGSDKWRYKLDWLGRLHTYLGRHLAPSCPAVLCGDFNIAR